MTKKRNIFILIFAVIAIIAIIFARQIISNNQNTAAGGGGRSAAVISVETTNAAARKMQEIREFNGTIRASYTYVVSAKVPGRLMSINKRIGDRVRANEVIGRIDDTEFRTNLNEANTQLAHTQTELNRARDLFEKGIVSKAEFDAIETRFQTQRARRDLAQTAYENTYIRAAQGGFVALRHTDGGALLSRGTEVLTIVGIDTVFAEIAVGERDFRNITAGKKATVRAEAIPNQSFDGAVHRVAPFFQTSSRTAAVEVALRNENHLLKPGMSARISIIVNEDDNAQVIPSAALVERGGVQSVFIVNDENNAELVPVQTGIYDGRFVQILSPEITAPIVTLGQHLLRPNSAVRVVNGDRGGGGGSDRGSGGGRRGRE